MDVVKTRIQQLNGTIEVELDAAARNDFHYPIAIDAGDYQQLAGSSCRTSSFRCRSTMCGKSSLSHERDVVTVHGKQTFDVRGEFIPLVGHR